MDLKHSFTVPAPVGQTWAAFNDIESVAGCFPGATVTSVEGQEFKGSCKVKLGPIALVYNGSGHFVDRDEGAGRFVIEAKGKDKRGNGTAGATVTATLADAGGSTQVDVVTDLSITGKPAQFGRGLIQDVSDKLLQQFVTCLESTVGGADADASADPGAGAAVEVEARSKAASDLPKSNGTGAGPAPAVAAPTTPTGSTTAHQDDALDLGSTVLPVLLRSYGKQLALAAGGLLVVLLLRKLLRRRR